MLKVNSYTELYAKDTKENVKIIIKKNLIQWDYSIIFS